MHRIELLVDGSATTMAHATDLSNAEHPLPSNDEADGSDEDISPVPGFDGSEERQHGAIVEQTPAVMTVCSEKWVSPSSGGPCGHLRSLLDVGPGWPPCSCLK